MTNLTHFREILKLKMVSSYPPWFNLVLITALYMTSDIKSWLHIEVQYFYTADGDQNKNNALTDFSCRTT